MTPKLTDAGRNLLLRALAGETINFTKVQIGNGPAQTPSEATALINPILTIEFTDIDVGDTYVTLAAFFTNGEVTSGFHITEAGYFATDPDDESQEILYAIGNEDESTADYVPDNTNRILEMQLNSLIFVGDAENVTAAISSSLVYATKEAFDAHTADHTNPHAVTKAQVGLGNVPNVATNDQTPTFTEATTLANIASGETLRTIFGKIKFAITNFINHINNRSNPHRCTASQVGAAAIAHTHNATDINAGTLTAARGGTGYTSLSSLATVLASSYGLAKTVTGSYVGTGDYQARNARRLTFTSPPKLLVVMIEQHLENASDGGFIAVAGITSSVAGGIMRGLPDPRTELYFVWSGNSVLWYSENNAGAMQNLEGKTYRYFAIL